MSIPSISGVGRVAPSAADTPASAIPSAATTARAGTAAPAVAIDEFTQQPVPPRFPWLSRLSQELESAAKRRPAFAPAPMLGDHVDKSA
ncbi:MAG TPA: hypothetical protein VNU48_12890 [Burkholderiaceae bacterium]|nr:hypothetical protein [Burkholderiaceae bacterium]